MPEQSPGSDSASDQEEPGSETPSWWSVRRGLQVGGTAVGLVAVVTVGVLATPPGAYADLADCEELFTEELLDGVHLAHPDVSVEEWDLTHPERHHEQSKRCVDADLGQFTADLSFYSPDTRNDRYEGLEERVATARENAGESTGGPEGGQEGEVPDPPDLEAERIEDIDVGEGGFAVVYDERISDASPSDPGGSEAEMSSFTRADFRTRNIHVSILYIGPADERSTSDVTDTVTVTRIAEAVEERIDDTSTAA
ncbi:hypothetical protein [Halostreptopolyspora alba]|uniref:DUF3558 domain-containing protein n=1 Tax=Halostreptopolyspora alba TaxID=2487137 RepID=A0A3N0EI86_9ACTN|nr:hypothetical protein EFW17_01375 [Nocardiopsaceae bacterium YIM 96095]